MRIVLKNTTRYRDDDLRAIVRGACAAAGVGAQVLTVFVAPARRPYVSGWAFFPKERKQPHNRMKMRIPAPGICTVEQVAQVALHEAMHLRGARHRDMTEEQYHCRMPVPWADNLLLRVREEAPLEVLIERKAAAKADRLEHAQKMLRRAATRSKRAATIEKKWERRVRLLSKE